MERPSDIWLIIFEDESEMHLHAKDEKDVMHAVNNPMSVEHIQKLPDAWE